jgi:hypothetical protein
MIEILNFERMLEALTKSGDKAATLRLAAIQVHDSFDVARTIAHDLFGADWQEHVADVYDRLVRAEAQLTKHD